MRAGGPVIAGRALIALLVSVIIYSGSGLCAVHHVPAPLTKAALFSSDRTAQIKQAQLGFDHLNRFN